MCLVVADGTANKMSPSLSLTEDYRVGCSLDCMLERKHVLHAGFSTPTATVLIGMQQQQHRTSHRQRCDPNLINMTYG